jgi:hypothetical protein
MKLLGIHNKLLALAALLAVALVASACGVDAPADTGSAEQDSVFEDAIDPSADPEAEVSVLLSERAVGSGQEAVDNEPGEDDARFFRGLGFVDGDRVLKVENGGRVPVGEDKVVEVYLSPDPPDWRTDLHLFLLDKVTFEPVEDLDVVLDYDMIYMAHGILSSPGSKVADGHYLIPLDFLMYGDWNVEVRLDLPEGPERLKFVVKFLPCSGC